MGEKDRMNTAPQWHRRWYQFSLRTLLLVTLLCSITLSLSMVIWARLHRGNVQGTVMVNGLALERGSITFVRAAGTVAKKETAPIQGGQYAQKRKLASGSYKVEIRAPQKAGSSTIETLPARYNANTQLMLDVMAGENWLDVDLIVESTGGEEP